MEKAAQKTAGAPLNLSTPNGQAATQTGTVSHNEFNSPGGPEKVIVIGLSKTGTTTLKDMLEKLGYRVCGPRKELLAEIRAGNMAAIDPVLDSYDAFEDWPWPLAYKYILERHGNKAKFILTTRSTTEKWLESIKQHGYGKSIFKSMHQTYGYYRPYGREKKFASIYETHNDEVRRFFSNHPEQLMEFCLENGDGWDKLCEFLEQARPKNPVPHRNKTDPRKRVLNRLSNKLVEPFYRVFCLIQDITGLGRT